MISDFERDVREKSRLARMAKYRKSGAKSKKCPMSTDHMTYKQWKERNGAVMTLKLNEPMKWNEFSVLSPSLQKEYIDHLIEEFGATATAMSEMLGVSYKMWTKFVKKNDFKFNLHAGRSMSKAQKERWKEFLGEGDGASGEGADVGGEPAEAAPAEPEPKIEANDTPPMQLKEFTMEFSGAIDALGIADMIWRLVGEHATGTVKLTVTTQ